MRIAHFVQRYPPALGGAEAYFEHLSRYLVEAGDAVTVFTTTALDLEAFWSRRARSLEPGRSVADGVEVRRYAPGFRFRGRRWLLKALRMLPHRGWQALMIGCNPICRQMWTAAGSCREPFDVVHAAAFPYGWPIACARRLARRLGVPFVLTPFLHLGDPDDPHDRTRRGYVSPALMALARSADRLFVQTEGEWQALRDHGISEERLVLQGMGLDRASCTGGDRERARRAWGACAGEVVIGHLANNSHEKGTIDLVEASNRAWERGGRFRLVLAGPAMANFRRFWASHRPAGPVLALGPLDDDEKRDFFAGIDVFALPSRCDSFGLVLPEAWANGVPNIGYRAGGVAWVIRDGVDGLLVRCGDLDGLATALLRLTEDADLRRRLGDAGQKRTRHEFHWEEKLELVRSVYRELANQHRPRVMMGV